MSCKKGIFKYTWSRCTQVEWVMRVLGDQIIRAAASFMCITWHCLVTSRFHQPTCFLQVRRGTWHCLITSSMMMMVVKFAQILFYINDLK